MGNYFKTAWRSLKKNKGFFALNFIGLYLSVVVSILIALILLYDTSFDQSPVKGISMYRVVGHSSNAAGSEDNAVTPYPLAAAMRAALPDNKLISQISFARAKNIVSFENKKFHEKDVVFADSVFPKLFPLTLKEGSLQRAFTDKGYAVLTEQTAARYFGKEHAVGKHIKYQNAVDLTVAAVIADPPANSHLPYTMLISYPTLTSDLIGGFSMDQWTLHASGYVYIGLSNANEKRQVETTLAAIVTAHIPPDSRNAKTEFTLQAFRDIHFNQLYAASTPSVVITYSYLYLLGAIGLFLILAACINYTNLSTALAIRKSKEVGVRKTMGATRGQLIRQFLSETFLLTALVIVIAALTVRPFLPLLNSFLDKNMPLDWINSETMLVLAGLWVSISLLSGIYPAFVLSGFNPITALQSKLSTPKASTIFLRRGLVTFQFLTAQILIIGAIVVAKQLAFIQSTPLGFQQQNVLNINLPDNKAEHARAFRDQLSAIPGISAASFSLGAPVSRSQVGTDFNLREKFATEKLDVAIKAADKDYLSTYGLRLVAGRWFNQSDENATADAVPDSLKRYTLVLNETATKTLGFAHPEDALGKYLIVGLNDLSAPVIGVVKDFHIASLHKPVEPVVLINFPFFYYTAGIKFSGGYSISSLAAIEKAFNSAYPGNLFESEFLDEHVAGLYKDERRTQQLFNIFTFLSIAINILGLVGLLSFMIEQKTKEIGVRKVLGATIADISLVLSKDFIRLIIIAFLLAAPVAWYLMHNWLQDFAYRTSISWWIFAATVLGAIAITALAVGYQTIKAALMNPIKSLRSE